ncbi:uncharacterized protein BP5553_01460 [Venustampulla echinocandica]|uniref:N-acetyltransferase domain-containing protein n=1 Tax=Venustampulla echinocandica TaxID=2656787 RepID=A0A370U129_9HELO|nr:uncharacterized protein BP5553_01460 [Venustampulla echinocandica]RDL41481.1 hypothetical protein BP5553_01460 [Venustampulla echinocandica]
MSQSQPVGPVTSSSPALAPNAASPSAILHGKHVTLRPLSPSDAPLLFKCLCGPPDDALWTYMHGGPYPDLESFTSYISSLCNGGAIFPLVILLRPEDGTADGVPVGITTLLAIVPAHRSIEIGYVTYARQLQRTTAATEAVFLLLQYSFDVLGYSRVEWKCNALNGPSKAAAKRLGFVAEGEFRKHMIVKGRRRDTAWFSILDDEWQAGVKKALVEWLDEGNFDSHGIQKRKLEEIRQETIKD